MYALRPIFLISHLYLYFEILAPFDTTSLADEEQEVEVIEISLKIKFRSNCLICIYSSTLR